MTKRYFERPTQVAFWSFHDKDYLGGIAYRDEIICGCCGETYLIDEIICDANAFGVEPIKVYDEWLNIAEDICGDCGW